MHSEPVLEATLHVLAKDGPPRLEAKLRVPPGVTVLRGPSGAGKTTCLMALAGLVRPARGRIVLGERTLFDHERKLWVPAAERRVGLVFQSLALFPHLTVAENVVFGIPRPLAAKQRSERAAHWLERMRVAALRDRRIATLSGGEAQRVALARALASEPELLLLDEPFSALDVALRRELTCELATVVSELAVPALLVSHHVEELERFRGRSVELPSRATTCAREMSGSGRALVGNSTRRLLAPP